MPQAGYSPVLLYASQTAGHVPSAPNLTNTANGSEIAINIADGLIFYKDPSGAVKSFGSMVYPGAGIPNSTGSAWGTSYSTTGTGTVVSLQTSPLLITPTLSGATIDNSAPYLNFGNGAGTATVAGRMWYDGTTGSLNFGMGGGNITQQVGEEIFVYGKASAAISGNTLLQAVYKTGTVGASGVIQFAPTVSGLTDPGVIIGVATEDISSGGFGRITNFGIIHGVNTSGSTYSETWHDNDDIWYNPVTGGLTNVKPVSPNMKTKMGTVINAGSGGSGSFQVFLEYGSILGGTDSNVQFGSLNNNDLIQYNSTLGYWTNVAPSTVLGLQYAKLATSASVASGSQFFTSTVRPFLSSGHMYKFTYNLVFTKSTSGTVTFGFNNSTSSNFSPISADITLIQEGYGTTAVSNLYTTGSNTATTQSSFSLTDATGYVATITGYVIPTADMRLQLYVSDSAGTITSQLGSNFIITDFGSATTIGNIA